MSRNKIRERMHRWSGNINIWPTTRGFTLEVGFSPDGIRYNSKAWKGIKEGNVNDHYRTDLHRALDEALDWLDRELP